MKRIIFLLLVVLSLACSLDARRRWTPKISASLPVGTAFVTNNPSASTRNNFSGAVGWGYTETAVRTIPSLGRFIISGNNQIHTLTLYDVTTGTTVGTVVIDTVGKPAGAYAYESITPVVTVIGHDYTVTSVEVSGLDEWYDFGSVTIVAGPTAWGSVAGSIVGPYTNNQLAYGVPNFLWY